jgi:hypothetical protein
MLVLPIYLHKGSKTIVIEQGELNDYHVILTMGDRQITYYWCELPQLLTKYIELGWSYE